MHISYIPCNQSLKSLWQVKVSSLSPKIIGAYCVSASQTIWSHQKKVTYVSISWQCVLWFQRHGLTTICHIDFKFFFLFFFPSNLLPAHTYFLALYLRPVPGKITSGFNPCLSNKYWYFSPAVLYTSPQITSSLHLSIPSPPLCVSGRVVLVCVDVHSVCTGECRIINLCCAGGRETRCMWLFCTTRCFGLCFVWHSL